MQLRCTVTLLFFAAGCVEEPHPARSDAPPDPDPLLAPDFAYIDYCGAYAG